jgi:transketolase
MRTTFSEIVTKIAKKDKRLVVLVGDISHGLFENLRKFAKDRYFNIGINEQSMINIAAGLSLQGFNPIVHTIAPFLIDRNFEQLKLDFSYQKQNINLVSIGGSFDYSKLGCTHHSYSDVSLIMHLDNNE